jgi:hypothetical protein
MKLLEKTNKFIISNLKIINKIVFWISNIGKGMFYGLCIIFLFFLFDLFYKQEGILIKTNNGKYIEIEPKKGTIINKVTLETNKENIKIIIDKHGFIVNPEQNIISFNDLELNIKSK